jgi:hypothetical protein
MADEDTDATQLTIKQEADPGSNTQKDPDQWVTGDEPATGAQRSYLQTLAEEAGEPVPEDLTKAEASKRIDALQDETGRDGGGGR